MENHLYNEYFNETQESHLFRFVVVETAMVMSLKLSFYFYLELVKSNSVSFRHLSTLAYLRHVPSLIVVSCFTTQLSSVVPFFQFQFSD